jgi:hypothetical protein
LWYIVADLELLLSVSNTAELVDWASRGNLLALEPHKTFVRKRRHKGFAIEMLHTAAQYGHSVIVEWLVLECLVDPNDDGREWTTLNNAIASDCPRTVRRVLELSTRRPDMNAFDEMPQYLLSDKSEIIQLLLDHGACEDDRELAHIAERLVDRGCDFRDDFPAHFDCGSFGEGPSYAKQDHPLSTACFFAAELVECFRERLKLRGTFGYQRDRFAAACVHLAELNWPVLVVIAVVDELPVDFSLLDLHHKWLISHRVQRFYAKCHDL